MHNGLIPISIDKSIGVFTFSCQWGAELGEAKFIFPDAFRYRDQFDYVILTRLRLLKLLSH